MRLIVAIFVSGLILISLSCGAVTQANTPSERVGSGDAEDVLVHPVWSKNATIYEVNLRQHTAEGTLNAFQKDLPRLKALGVDILWLMPVFPIGEVNRMGGENKSCYLAELGSSSLGSPYSIKDYTDINPDLGTLADFVEMVDEAHLLGMKVILDWVANHSAFDCEWTETHRGFYLMDNSGNLQPPTGTDLWDVTQLDWENGVQNGLYNGMANAMEFWVTEADIDGFRCDHAEKIPVAFWDIARRRLEALKPEIFMLAAADVPAHHNRAFDMSYAEHYHHLTNEIAQGREDASVLREYLTEEAKKFQTDAYRMGFATNHDENSWNGPISERYGEAGDAMVILSGMLLDMPLIYSGQESGLDKRLRFYEKDTVEWGEYAKADFYRSINVLHHEEQALWNGDYGGAPELLACKSPEKIFAFTKRKEQSQVVVAVNLSADSVPLSINMPEGEFVAVMRKNIDANGVVSPWGYIVLKKADE